MQALTTATMQSYALLFALKHEDPKITIEQVDEMISAYKESGKDYDELIVAIQRAYLLSNHPSSLASQEERWKAFKTMKATEQKIQEKREKVSSKKVAEAIARLEKQLQEIDSGEAPPASAIP
jgi:PAB1-binding protein PBP1